MDPDHRIQQNIKLTLAYDGSRYFGWQKTQEGPSIEEELQKAVEQIVQHAASLQAASRTDAGVHAMGQVVNFFTHKQLVDANKLRASLNSLLPKDIVVTAVEFVSPLFHPTLDSEGKEYRYFVCLGPVQLPHNRHTSWHVPYSPDLSAIRAAIPHLIGTHDFSAFCNAKKNSYYSDCTRTIHRLDLMTFDDQRLCFCIRGNRFLYKMVRNIVGLLIDVGKGKICSDSIPSILKSRSRPQAGVTAPACGLFLFEVFYAGSASKPA